MNTAINIREYQIFSPTYFIIRDAEETRDARRARLLFHVKTGDYFAVVATVLGFIEEALEDREEGTEVAAATMLARTLVPAMRNDLLFLHEHYDIREKTETSYRPDFDDGKQYFTS